MGVHRPLRLTYTPLQNKSMVANLLKTGSARVLRFAARKPSWSAGSRVFVMQGSASEAVLFQQLQQAFFIKNRHTQLLGLGQL
ncbi:hypothetical protein SAMN04487961_1951 [Marinobacter pelagius]|uniref:Uncharacterized protein n=1 Tax=Marinobacter pelagius TaxID=379482 RepID=A0A1I4VVR9_9GAMM|nr:hypothetical protein SAMN04487961_1951 [Marinobacter pelagius]